METAAPGDSAATVAVMAVPVGTPVMPRSPVMAVMVEWAEPVRLVPQLPRPARAGRAVPGEPVARFQVMVAKAVPVARAVRVSATSSLPTSGGPEWLARSSRPKLSTSETVVPVVWAATVVLLRRQVVAVALAVSVVRVAWPALMVATVVQAVTAVLVAPAGWVLIPVLVAMVASAAMPLLSAMAARAVMAAPAESPQPVLTPLVPEVPVAREMRVLRAAVAALVALAV